MKDDEHSLIRSRLPLRIGASHVPDQLAMRILADVSGVTLGFWRMWIATVVMSVVCVVTRRRPTWHDIRHAGVEGPGDHVAAAPEGPQRLRHPCRR